MGLQQPNNMVFERIKLAALPGCFPWAISFLIEQFTHSALINANLSGNLRARKPLVFMAGFNLHKSFIINHDVPPIARLRMSPRERGVSITDRNAASFSEMSRDST